MDQNDQIDWYVALLIWPVSMSQILCPLSINTQLELFRKLPGNSSLHQYKRSHFEEQKVIQRKYSVFFSFGKFKVPDEIILEYVIQLVSVILA